jgi:hypothetical protein
MAYGFTHGALYIMQTLFLYSLNSPTIIVREGKMKHVLVVALVLAALVLPAHSRWENAGMFYVHPDYGNMRYGKYEIRAQIVQAPGVVSCFVLITEITVREADRSRWHEFDIEFCGALPHVDAVAHCMGPGSGVNPNYYWPAPISADMSGYHTHTVIYCLDSVVWMFDGMTYRRAYNNANGSIHEDRYNLGGTDLVSSFDYSDIDWIAKYGEELKTFQFDLWPDPGYFAGCGSPNGSTNHMFCSYFAYYDWTKGEGPDGSDWTLKDWDSYEDDALDPERWGGWTGPGGYGVICRDGKALCTLGDDAVAQTVSVPDDPDDITNAEFTKIAGGTSTKNGKVMSNYRSFFNYKDNQITFNLGQSSHVKFEMYSLNGSHVATLLDKTMDAGKHTIQTAKISLPAGSYVLAMHTPSATSVRKLVTIN